MGSSQFRLPIFALLIVGAFAVVTSRPVMAQSNGCYYNSGSGQWVCINGYNPYYGGYYGYPYYRSDGYGYGSGCTIYYYPYSYATYSPYFWYHYGYYYNIKC